MNRFKKMVQLTERYYTLHNRVRMEIDKNSIYIKATKEYSAPFGTEIIYNSEKNLAHITAHVELSDEDKGLASHLRENGFGVELACRSWG